MMKEKLLFVIPEFSIGGITSSLASLVKYLKEDFEIEILCRNNPDNLKTWHGVKVLDENIWLSLFLYHQSIFCILISKFLRILRVMLRFCHVDIYPVYCFLGGRQIKSKNYSSVISFHENINSIICYLPAKNKIAWTHSIYSRFIAMKGNIDETKYLKRFASVVFVSEFAKNDFLSILPHFKNKAAVVYNIIDQEAIKKQAEMQDDGANVMTGNSFNIVSIGRIDSVKQFHKIPFIARRVRALTDKSFKWFVIGDGDEKIVGEVKKCIKDFDLEKYVYLLGSKENVFPYLKRSNLLVHTSSSETCSLVVNEALSLGIPVVVNNYGCASEFIANERFGYIIPNDDMHSKIAELINDDDKMTYLKEQLSGYHVHNNEAVLAFKKLV